MTGPQNWRTPKHLFDLWSRELGPFTLDAAADAENALCEQYCDEANSGLLRSWRGESVWCNPPYGKIAPWLAKAEQESKGTAMVVALVPANTGSRWFVRATAHCRWWLFAGRIKFVSPDGAKNSAPMYDNALMQFRRWAVPGLEPGFAGYRDAKTGELLSHSGIMSR